MRGKLIIALVTGLAVSASFMAVRAYIRHSEAELMEHKIARAATGIVTGKEHVQFRSDQTEYQDEEGQPVHLEDWRKKSGEFRIFYKIDNFDQIPGVHRTDVANAEKEREQRFGSRFRAVNQQTFDQATKGQAVNVTYRWTGDSKIEILSFELASQTEQR